MIRFVRTFSLICLCVCASLSYGWISPGDGRLYTMDTSTVKPPTDITNFTSDVSWNGVDHFYLVGDTLLISNLTAPDTLTISPGTVVKFTVGMDVKIDIDGVLMAIGTPTDTIVFTSDAPVPDTADWNDIRFTETSIDSLCELSYCKVEYARWGIGCKGASPTISHCRIRNNGLVGVTCIDDASPLISYNTIENTSEYGIWCSGTSSPIIKSNAIGNNYFGGINCCESSSPVIELNSIFGSLLDGIHCGDVASPVIRGNVISQNLWGVTINDSASPVIGGSLSHVNDIYDNLEWEVRNFTSDTVKAEFNYWGTVEEDSIVAGIENNPDAYTDYIPWVNAAHDTAYPPNQLPLADAGSAYTGYEGSSIVFSGSGSTDDWGIASWEWDFDEDGVYDSSGMNVTHSWSDDHTGTVILRVTDTGGLTDTDTATVVVENVAPIADAGGAYSGGVNELIQLTGFGIDPGLDSLTFEWDLDGDGEYDDAEGQNPARVWSLPGDYAIYLRVTEEDGGVGTDSAIVSVVRQHFIRADVNADSIVTVGDAVYLLRYIYIPGSPSPPCMKAADADDSGDIQMSDVLYLVRYLYVPGDPEPPFPFPSCGEDPTPDGLGCSSHPCASLTRTRSLIGNKRPGMDE